MRRIVLLTVPAASLLCLTGCIGTQDHPVPSGLFTLHNKTTLSDISAMQVERETKRVTLYRSDRVHPAVVAQVKVLEKKRWIISCQTNFTSDRLETWLLESDALPQALYLSAGCGEDEVLLMRHAGQDGHDRFVVFRKNLINNRYREP